MKKESTVKLTGLLAGAAMLFGTASGALAAPATQVNTYPFADPEIQRMWSRTDAPVLAGRAQRSFYWGPAPISGALMEDFANGGSNKHLVQYFDKGRMEINNPSGDKSSPWYVTAGLLTRELISGYIQTGPASMQDHWRAEIPIAGDTDDATAPTYASFRDVAGASTSNPRPVGEVIVSTINRTGQVGQDARYATYNVKVGRSTAVGEFPSYNIPDVFWQFLNASGPISAQGRPATGRLSDPWFYVTGLPIGEAYWASVKIAGKPNTDVLIQPYERRVLTYVPSAPQGWQVQMGNIGQHYYDWRYKGAGKPTSAVCASQPPAGPIGTLWTQNTQAQLQLGCAMPGGAYPVVVVQHFEHGTMFDLIMQVPASHGQTTIYKEIYVLYDNGTARMFVDGYNPAEGQLAYPTAPTDLYTPKNGFGKVWLEQQGVREALGWALAPEDTPADHDFLRFEHGMAIKAGSADSRVYVLYNNSGLSSVIDRWVAYNTR